MTILTGSSRDLTANHQYIPCIDADIKMEITKTQQNLKTGFTV